MNKRQREVRKAIDYLVKYWADYRKLSKAPDWTNETIIDDALYGLGVALFGKEHEFADGYEKTRAKLLEHLRKAEEADNKATRRAQEVA